MEMEPIEQIPKTEFDVPRTGHGKLRIPRNHVLHGRSGNCAVGTVNERAFFF